MLQNTPLQVCKEGRRKIAATSITGSKVYSLLTPVCVDPNANHQTPLNRKI